MGKETIISTVIVILIIIGNIVTQNFTVDSVETITNQLSELKTVIFEKEENINEEEIKNKLEEIEKNWESRHDKLAYYIEHDELEKVEAEIALMEGQSESELYDEICPELEKCIFILEHIEDKTALNVKNIF